MGLLPAENNHECWIKYKVIFLKERKIRISKKYKILRAGQHLRKERSQRGKGAKNLLLP